MAEPRYNVTLYQSSANYVHTLSFYEIGQLLAASFRSLGIPCRVQFNKFETDAVNILLGYNKARSEFIPNCEYIVYQLEQLTARDGWRDTIDLKVLQRAREVWDYAPENIEILESLGLKHVSRLPIGFHPELDHIQHVDPDIDVLFYGCVNARRKEVLDKLAQSCQVATLFGIYGAPRDEFISRAKVVLNVHFYESQIMEQVRLSYLLNNRCFVISEQSAVNPFDDAIVTAPLTDLADCCLSYLDQPQERRRIADAGYEWFQQRPMTEYLKQVLPSTPSVPAAELSDGRLESEDARCSSTPHKLNPLNSLPPVSYRSNERMDVLEMVRGRSLPCARVLEIGCGSGDTGKRMKEDLGTRYYVGIEISPEAAQRAKMHLDEVHTANIEDVSLAELNLAEDFDLLLGLDVIEHLYNPWDTLARLVTHLRPGGHVLLSIPNIQNLSMLQGLAAGQWNYVGAGLLDVTHIRFFTLQGIEMLVKGAGLHFADSVSKLHPKPNLEQLKDEGNAIQLGKMQIGGLTRKQVIQFFTYQYLVLGRKPVV